MADRIGQQLGNYRLIRPIGHGGFADVYLGEHIYLQTQVAIKLLQMRLAKEDMEGFLKEARIIAHLVHPHIVRVLDFGIEGGTPFLVMDYAPNGTLRQRHPKGTTLPLTTITSYVEQVADALQYAHDQRVIHRDVKPENMLVGEHDELLLSDFGIAIVAQSSRYRSTQSMGGTMAYIAPEQIQGHPRTASDQYSLGIVVYEWLSGSCPFHGSMTEIVAQHLAVPPPSLCEKVPTISPDMEQVVLTALEKYPHRRFESMQAFAAALGQASQTASSHQVVLPTEVPLPRESSLPSDGLAAPSPGQPPLPTHIVTPLGQSSLPTEIGTPPIAAIPSRFPDVSPPLTRESVPLDGLEQSKRGISRRTVLVALAGVAAAGAGIAWLTHSQEPRAPSPLSHLTATPSPIPIPLGTTLLTYTGHPYYIWSVAWSPDGKRIASGSWDQTVQVWDAMSGKNVLTYHGHTGAQNGVYTVAWSPDGKRIASGAWDQTVQVWDASTDGHILTYRGHSGGIHKVAWSPDGKRIVSGSFDHVAQVWDASTGGHVLTYRGHSDFIYWVAWSPDGKYIVSGSRDKTVQVWDAFTGDHVLTYSGHSSSVDSVAWSSDSKRIASAGGDSTVQVWDAFTGDHVLTYSGHSIEVHSVAWSPDGKRIASASFDHTVQVWDASTGGHILTYRGHSASIFEAAWSPDGKRIASGSLDNTVQVWVAE